MVEPEIVFEPTIGPYKFPTRLVAVTVDAAIVFAPATCP